MKTDIIHGDAFEALLNLPLNSAQLCIADPPYFNVQNEDWDKQFEDEDNYLSWSSAWINAVNHRLTDEGVLVIFGQLGKKEQVFLPLMAEAREIMNYHDLIIWDRVVGYDRRDSFLPAYEMALVLKKGNNPYFSDEVRISYDEDTKKKYLRDKRYKDKEARAAYLEQGKRSTNIISVPSLKGSSKEKCGHPTQKPEKLIEIIIRSYSKEGDTILDPFAGSFTVAKVAQELGRNSISIEKEKEYVEMGKKRLNIS